MKTANRSSNKRESSYGITGRAFNAEIDPLIKGHRSLYQARFGYRADRAFRLGQEHAPALHQSA